MAVKLIHHSSLFLFFVYYLLPYFNEAKVLCDSNGDWRWCGWYDLKPCVPDGGGNTYCQPPCGTTCPDYTTYLKKTLCGFFRFRRACEYNVKPEYYDPVGATTCFGVQNEVIIKRNDTIKSIKLGNLMIGDEIYSRNLYNNNAYDDLIWSKVWYIDYHNNKNWSGSAMLEIAYKCIGNDNEQHIHITHQHLLYIFDEVTQQQRMITADQVQINDKLIIYQNEEETIIFCNVNKIDNIIEKSIYPLTTAGDIVVSKVVASSYTISKENALKIHSFAANINFDASIPINNKHHARRLKTFAKQEDKLKFDSLSLSQSKSIYTHEIVLCVGVASTISISILITIAIYSCGKSKKHKSFDPVPSSDEAETECDL